MPVPVCVSVRSQVDVERAQRSARVLASGAGLSVDQTEAVVLATMELASNLVRYAMDGEMSFVALDGSCGVGVQIESRDAGPGIEDLVDALSDGFSTGHSLGCGLPAVRRLMDDFDIASTSAGTHVLARKWSRRHSS